MNLVGHHILNHLVVASIWSAGGPKFSHSRKGRSDGLDAVAQVLCVHSCLLVERRPID